MTLVQTMLSLMSQVSIDQNILDLGKNTKPTSLTETSGPSTRRGQSEVEGDEGGDLPHFDTDLDKCECELQSIHSDSDVSGPRYSTFSLATDLEDPKFRVGPVFPSFNILKKTIKRYSVKNMLSWKFWKNDKSRVVALIEKHCSWTLTS